MRKVNWRGVFLRRLFFIENRLIILGCQSHSINSHLTPKSFVIDFDHVSDVNDDSDDADTDDDDGDDNYVVRYYGISRR